MTDYLEVRKHGAWIQEDCSYKFSVWCPFSNQIDLHLVNSHKTIISMLSDEAGYWQAIVPQIYHGQQYYYSFNNQKDFPDPASFWQPAGVKGASAVVDHSLYRWGDEKWMGQALSEMIIYELHVGCFSKKGTFDGVIDSLGYLVDLGINAIELMPVAHFSGNRNWGYDGVFPYSVHPVYGGIEGLKRLVDNCHQHNISVILDVVYNHIGPEGSCLDKYGPYFLKDKYRTPWGQAINYDDAQCDEVRRFFIENVLYWFDNFHIDALRLDAIHAIYDDSAYPFLEELTNVVSDYNNKLGKPHLLIAESDRNDPRFIKSRIDGGFGINAQWNDDFHHALHAVITGERDGYYQDFGDINLFAKVIRQGYAYTGDYSRYRKRRHGAPTNDLSADRFIVYSQNHDQVGNRCLSERLISLVGFEAAKTAAACVILSPMVPLLFMGEEWGEDSPFYYFADFEDMNLRNLVTTGRQQEFLQFNWQHLIADPFLEKTYQDCKLKWLVLGNKQQHIMQTFYKELIKIRKTHPLISKCSFTNLETIIDRASPQILIIVRESRLYYYINFGITKISLSSVSSCKCKLLISSSENRFGGTGEKVPYLLLPNQELELPAHSFTAYDEKR